MEARPDSVAGRLVAGRYALVRALGTGGMGTVYEARDARMGRTVAVKLLSREVRRSAELLERFAREARAAARLHHPNIVGVHELAHDDEHGPVIVMELLAGASLEERLRDERTLPEPLVIEIAIQMLDGLAAAHASGVVHRDVKPSNVFLIPLGATSVAAKLLDFGVAKLLEEDPAQRLTRQGAVLGTPMYMAPEQAAQGMVDARTDVYAVGACLYEMLTGRMPHAGSEPTEVMRQVLIGDIVDVAALRPEIAPALAAVVRKAMSGDPVARFESAAAMREALVQASRPAPREPPQRAAPVTSATAPTLPGGTFTPPHAREPSSRDSVSEPRAPSHATPPAIPMRRSLFVIPLLAIALALALALALVVMERDGDARAPLRPAARAIAPVVPRSSAPTGADPPVAPPASLSGEVPSPLSAPPDPVATAPASPPPPDEAGTPDVAPQDRAHSRRARASRPSSAPDPHTPAARAGPAPRVGTDILDPF